MLAERLEARDLGLEGAVDGSLRSQAFLQGVDDVTEAVSHLSLQLLLPSDLHELVLSFMSLLLELLELQLKSAQLFLLLAELELQALQVALHRAHCDVVFLLLLKARK